MNISIVQMLWDAFDVLAVITGIATIAFYYHWGRFSPSHFGAIATVIVYTCGTIVLISTMLAILSTISL